TIHQVRSVLFEHETVVEMRIIKTERTGTVSGYYNDLNRLATDAASWDGNVSAVYVTLNPVNESLLARSVNRYKKWAKDTTADLDILRRRWLMVDFDPVRPKGISSTDEEHEAAIERAKLCRGWLQTQGWPAPIFADSGNGAHLL